jgi:hypothetical protein
MYRDFFAHSHLLALPILSLAIFIAVFVGIVARVMGRRPEQYDNTAALPFENGDL